MSVSSKLAIYYWAEAHNLKKAQKRILIETWRRVHKFHKGNLNEKTLTVAFPSEVKTSKEFLKNSYGSEIPRINNWYSLTEKGKELMKDLSKRLSFKDGKEILSDEFNLELFNM